MFYYDTFNYISQYQYISKYLKIINIYDSI